MQVARSPRGRWWLPARGRADTAGRFRPARSPMAWRWQWPVRVAEIEMPALGIGGMIAVMDRGEITAEVAARLVAAQFPQWAGLPIVPVGLNGWDNTTFRLGGELSMRLPNGDNHAAQVAKEHRWLPVLAAHLPLPIPQPVALGRPGAGFPWPWSVYRWIEGEPACAGQLSDPAAFAADPGMLPGCAACHRRQRRAAAQGAQRLPGRPAEHLGRTRPGSRFTCSEMT